VKFCCCVVTLFLDLQLILRHVLGAGSVLSRPPCALVPVASSGEGQMAINALQLTELLADDSNYRRDAMLELAPKIADVLLLPMANFKSTWCAGESCTCSSSSVTLSKRTYLSLLLDPVYCF
jgi:hypothetical protein